VVLPKKRATIGKGKQIEHSEEFIEFRHKNSAVESSINALENHGLDRCPNYGYMDLNAMLLGMVRGG